MRILKGLATDIVVLSVVFSAATTFMRFYNGF